MGAGSAIRGRSLRDVTKALVARIGYTVVRGTVVRDDLVTHLETLFKELHVDCVLDVGANQGQFARLLRDSLRFQGRIASIEPQREVFERLRSAMAGDPSWSGHPIALGASETTAELTIFDRTEFSSFRRPSDYGEASFDTLAGKTQIESVPVRRLDDLWPDLVGDSRAVFLKLDTQGFDLEVLKGGTQSLPRVVGLVTEVAAMPIYEEVPKFSEHIQTLLSYGFDITGLYPETRDAALRVIEFNCVMRRSTSR